MAKTVLFYTKKWLVFMHGDRELCRYTMNHESIGERDATIELLAYENKIPKEEITTKVVDEPMKGITADRIQ